MPEEWCWRGVSVNAKVSKYFPTLFFASRKHFNLILNLKLLSKVAKLCENSLESISKRNVNNKTSYLVMNVVGVIKINFYISSIVFASSSSSQVLSFHHNKLTLVFLSVFLFQLCLLSQWKILYKSLINPITEEFVRNMLTQNY